METIAAETLPLSANQLEGAFLTGWPALKQSFDGLWLWRYARGFTRRSNSIQCLDPVDGAFAGERLSRLTTFSHQHRIIPTLRVTPLTAPEIVEVLDARQWEVAGPSLVLAMQTPASAYRVDFDTDLLDPADPAWFKSVAQLSGYDGKAATLLHDLVSRIPGDARGVLVRHRAGVPAAAALVAVASGIGVYFNVVTHPSARRSGFGRTAMSAALNWAKSKGAAHQALQVAEDNQPALNLYRSLGFRTVYAYHYRQAPAARQE
jgi:N-acetylglutamate synthase